MDVEAFGADTFSGAARRASERLLASAVSCKESWVLSFMGTGKAFLKGLTYRESAEMERMVCFALPPGSSPAQRALLGVASHDESQR
eukprot:7524248-Pyramimonas_sp.AAC.1